MCESPAWNLHTSLGGGVGGITIEVVGIRQVGCRKSAGRAGTQRERDVVDVVTAVVVGVARSEDVFEGDVVAVTGVGGEVDCDLGDGGGGVVD